jgi:hypothetical protein
MEKVAIINPRKPRAVFLYTMHRKMKNTIITAIYSHILFLFLTCNLATAEGKPELQKVRHTVLSSTSEQVTLQLNGSYSPKVFTLKGETPRIIFDFPDMTHSREVRGNATTNGTIVKRIRAGMHTTDGKLKTRVVFDVGTLQGVTYDQKFDDKSSTLTIQFTTNAKIAAPGSKNKAVSPPDKSLSISKDAAKKTADTKTVQAPPEVASDSKAPPKSKTVQNGNDVESQAEAKEPILQPTVSTEKAEEKKDPAIPAVPSQPKPTADSKASAKTKTTQTESSAKPQSTAPEASQKPAVTTEALEEKKTSAPVAPPPQAVNTTDTKPSVKTEAVKPAAPAGGIVGPLIESIKFDGTSPKGEMVLFKLNDFHPPVIHGVEEGIPRVICDFNSTQIHDSVKNLIKADGKFVKVIRVTKNKKPERIRVVLDLEPNRSYDLQQVFFKEDNLFVIIVNTIKK